MDILKEIEIYKRREIAEAKTTQPIDALTALANSAPPVRGFADTLRSAVDKGRFALIAEIKKASPSKGLIREDFDPARLARAYEDGGAVCLSVLTDTPSFQGAPEFLVAARAAVSLPVIRKDFMFDPYQVVQARAWGADCILIIMSAVTDAEAKELETTAIDWGMDVILEVHNEAELDRALLCKSPLIGVNNRDLKTFNTTLEPTLRLAPLTPADRLVIGESGISTHEDLQQLAEANVRCFLVGESLMRKQDVATATRDLLATK
jgi:indole-3-glycerol phosphate synthase